MSISRRGLGANWRMLRRGSPKIIRMLRKSFSRALFKPPPASSRGQIWAASGHTHLVGTGSGPVSRYPYLLVYDTATAPPVILRVAHMAQDLPRLLASLPE